MWASDDIAAMASAAGGGKFGNMSAELSWQLPHIRILRSDQFVTITDD